jgi:hypothetical protein
MSVVLFFIGAKDTILPSMSVSENPVAVTFTSPAASVTTVSTYLLPDPEVVCSQPQPLAVTVMTLLDAA